MSNQNHSNHKPSGFFYREEVIKWVLRIFYACSALLVIADFIVHRHIVTEIEKIPTFYALYSFITCVILVLIAKWMRNLLIRAEDYYDKPESPEEFFLQNQDLALPQQEKLTSRTTEKN